MKIAHAIRSLFLAAALMSVGALAQASETFEPIEIRLVAEQPSGGPAPLVQGTNEPLEVEQEALLGPTDFVSVGDVDWVEGKPGFNVALTDAGAQKYEQVSTDNVGRTLAIIVDGKVLADKLRGVVGTN